MGVHKEKVFSCFLHSLDELAALISAAHEQAQLAARYISALDTTQPWRNCTILCSKSFFFPELCESKTQLQNQRNYASEWGRQARKKKQEHREGWLSPGYVLWSGPWEATKVPAALQHTRDGGVSSKTWQDRVRSSNFSESSLEKLDYLSRNLTNTLVNNYGIEYKQRSLTKQRCELRN